MAFGFDSRSAARDGPGRPGPSAPAPAPAGPPAAAALVARWSADAIPAQPDGSMLASWTDAAGGLPATGSATFRTGGAGGKPFVLFAGGGAFLATSAGNAVTAAHRSGASTTLAAVRNTQATPYGYVAGYTGGSFALIATGSQVGTTEGAVPGAAAALTTVARVDGVADGLGSAGNSRIHVNGGCLGMVGRGLPDGGLPFGIGGNPANGNLYGGEVYEVLVWNRALTAAELLGAERWVRAKYASPLPWAGGPFRVFHGDSLTNGYGADLAGSYPHQLAQAKGWPLGSWSNLGTNAFTAAQMRTAAAAEIDPMAALLAPAPLHVTAFEWFNGKAGGAAACWAQMRGYLEERRAAGAARLVVGTSTDASDQFEAAGERQARADYDALVAANWAACADGYAALHADASVGVEGACPNAAPYGPYFSDGVHLTAAGYGAVAALVAPAMA